MFSVSVVIPVRDGERYILEAVESVLSQGALAGEVLVVDDGSTDGTTGKVLAIGDERVQLLGAEGTGRGVSAARNRGLAAARGTWTMFLDADDRLRPGAVTALFAAADADSVAVYGDYERIGQEGGTLGRRRVVRNREKPSGDIVEPLLGGNFIVNGGVMLVKTDVMRRLGGFDESLRHAEDWNAWCRLAASGPIVHLPGLHVLDYRMHAASAMMSRLLSSADCRAALDATFTDPSIVARVPALRRAALRRKAESHMNAYVIAQAVRARRLGAALRSLAETLVCRPRQGGRAVVFFCAALAGL